MASAPKVKQILPLNDDVFERIFIYNALLDISFLEQVIEYAKPSYFKDKDIRVVYDILHTFYVENNVVPNITEIKAHIVETEKRESLKKVVLSFYDIDKKYDKLVLIKNTERFLKEKAILQTHNKVGLDIQTGEINSSQILSDYEKVCNISLIENLGFDYLESIDKHCEDLQKVFTFLPTKWDWLDEKIGGGLLASGRSLYVFFGITNVGKSIFLGNLATNILSQNKTVVLISLEMPEQVYAKRISAQLSKIPFGDLHLNIEPLKDKLGQYKMNNSDAKLIIKEFPPRTISPLHLKVYIDRLIRSGIKPDVVILDYINLLIPSDKGGVNSYEKVKEITEDVRALSYAFECPFVSATQKNKSGYDAGNTMDTSTTGESMGLAHTADVQISIWTDESDFDLGIMHYGLVKNRFGPRNCQSTLLIDYPTLSLDNPDSVMKELDANDKLPIAKKPVLSSADSSVNKTLSLFDSISN